MYVNTGQKVKIGTRLAFSALHVFVLGHRRLIGSKVITECGEKELMVS